MYKKSLYISKSDANIFLVYLLESIILVVNGDTNDLDLYLRPHWFFFVGQLGLKNIGVS